MRKEEEEKEVDAVGGIEAVEAKNHQEIHSNMKFN